MRFLNLIVLQEILLQEILSEIDNLLKNEYDLSLIHISEPTRPY